MTDFDAIRDYWDLHAGRDPLWAVLSESSKSGRRWDIARFFQTGASEIASVLYQLDSRGFNVARGSALDFGCGVGRLTQALAAHFNRVVGVDVSPRMLALAGELNAYPSRVSYVNNQRTDLGAFADRSVDFVVSNIVLQHVTPDLARGYIDEFVRILAPGGAAVFQIPSHRRSAVDAPAPSGPRAMADEAYDAAIAITGVTRLDLRAGAALTLDVVITNRSPLTWSASESGLIRAGNHWLDGTGERMLRRDDGRSSLPGILAPGETCRVALGITAPDADGEFVCEIDLAHEGVLWFHDKGSPTVRFPVRVGSVSHPYDSREPVRPHAPLSGPERAIDDTAFAEQFSGGGDDPGDFPMHGIERDEVVAAIERLGGRLIHIEDDHSCGEEWVSFRYYVTRGSA